MADARRGFVPEDEHDFSSESLVCLKKASGNIRYLINEGYDLKQAATFVGNHFLLSERQRMAIVRSVATDEQVKDRAGKRIGNQKLQGETVWVDGFNTIITLEVMLSRSPLFLCMDGAVRDLAALRGTYRLIPETEAAIKLLFDMLQSAGVKGIKILLDQPVSNSGRLKVLLAEVGVDYAFDLDVQILKDVDRKLWNK